MRVLLSSITIIFTAIASFAAPQLIPLVNADFESPALTPTNSWYAPAPGWYSNPSLGVVLPNPTIPPANSGAQYLWGGNIDNFELSQTVGSIDENSKYELVLDLYPIESANVSVLLRLNDLTAGAMIVEKQFHPFWDTDLEQFRLPSNQWTTVRMSFHGADFPGINGHTLSINISGSRLAVDNVRLYRTEQIAATPGTYYVSSSTGNDSNDGLSAASAWQSFSNLNERTFPPGSAILLKRGDVWVEELNLRGSGAVGAANFLGTYGSGPRPVIMRTDLEWDRCVVLNNASHWVISDLEGRFACLGIFLRYYKSVGHSDITIQNCKFVDMDSWFIDAPSHNSEFSGPAGIWIGGYIESGSPEEFSTVLDGLTIRNCAMENCTAGIGANWYFPALYRARVTNLLIEDCYATKVSIGGLTLHGVSNGTIRRFRTFEHCGKEGGFVWGSTGGIVSTCANLVFEDCEFAQTDRMWPDQTQGDGSGFDIDGNNDGITMRRCVFRDNDGPGLMTLSTYGIANSNVLIEDCTFYNNAVDASDSTYAAGGNAYELKLTEGTVASGTVQNCGLYRGPAATSWYYLGSGNNVTLLSLRQDYWSSYSGRLQNPVWNWNTNGNYEGWNTWHNWKSRTVSGGWLNGTANGNDTYGHSPDIWVNTRQASPYVRLRMRSTAGTVGQLFFITEADPTWNGAKSVGFTVNADGQWHDYVLDLRSSPDYTGIVTRLRLDPTAANGSQFNLDFVSWQPNAASGTIATYNAGWLGTQLLYTGGDPGVVFSVLKSPDQINWSVIGTTVSDNFGTAEFLDWTTYGQPPQFYTIAWP